MEKTFLCLHAASVLAAYSLFGLSYLVFARTGQMGTEKIVVAATVVILAAVGSLTGLGLMLSRSGKSESVALGVSTVAALLLLFLTHAVVS